MKLAFYAPLKPPDHPVPSGDRAMGQSLIAALKQAGATVTLASRLQTRDGVGDADVQRRLTDQAKAAQAQIISTGKAAGWQAWITYHNYYKAPDLLGPDVASALGIPYLQIEATRARKRLGGPWDLFARRAEAACDAAQTIFYLTARDGEALLRDAPQGQDLIHLRPFLNANDLPPQATGDGPMISVGMMRAGDKLESYRIIAQTLALLPDRWQLQIAGDGPMRPAVEALMAPFGCAVSFLGERDPNALQKTYAASSLLLWPGVNEAFGLTYLEAQAAALPVVAQDRPGVCDVLAPGEYPADDAGRAALAARISTLLDDPVLRRKSGKTACRYVATHHLMASATACLHAGLARAGVAP